MSLDGYRYSSTLEWRFVEGTGTIPQLTSRIISQSRVIAKGKRIRDVQRLVETHGGKSSKWVKKSSPRFAMGMHQYEYHWYEHPGIGRVEVKRKQVHSR